MKKRVFCAFLSIVLVSVCTLSVNAYTLKQNEYYLGDVNQDASVTAVDARQILQIASGVRSADDTITKIADMNQDGKITAVDARQALQTASGIRMVSVINIKTGAISQIPASEPVSFEQQMLDRVNQERAAAGLAPLTLNAALCANAHVRAQEISQEGQFSHTRPDGTTCFTAITVPYYTAAENIAYATYRVYDADAIMDLWMNSAGHRSNILNPYMTEAGFGCYVVDGIGYWTQFFVG